MVNVEEYFSHPDKELTEHLQGVLFGVKKRTASKIAELLAIFHDIGKLNPHFQEKLKNGKSEGYSNHAYLSGYIFLRYCYANLNSFRKYVANDSAELWLAALLTIIVSHHKDLPDFPLILKESERNDLVSFLKKVKEIPASSYLQSILTHTPYKVTHEYAEQFINELPLKIGITTQKLLAEDSLSMSAIDFFLDTQFMFASLITADKGDAGNYFSDVDSDKFSKCFNLKLNSYIEKFNRDTALNRLRTDIRKEALLNINKELQDDKRSYSLIAPTGSGKTIILLSLAGEIIKSKGDFRIIYALPFLSITEQVEDECYKIFGSDADCVARIDSKTENRLFATYQKDMDSNPEIIDKIVNAKFCEDTFDYPCIITTFVRVFETLLSNKNSTLLKLPNFSRCIFLIDEIQALPPRLYGFFVALLDCFCKKFDSYVIFSSATMPNFELPTDHNHKLKDFFRIRDSQKKEVFYKKPSELVGTEYFRNPIFDRYKIENDKGRVDLERLASLIVHENASVLVIVNTIEDSRLLFDALQEKKDSDVKCMLINTHFIPKHRGQKILAAKRFLKKRKKVILVSTQLIEAGVDIDFPIIYRDIAPIPSIVQSAGRCNRNGTLNTKGKVVLFELIRNDKSRASLIYRGADSKLLDNSKQSLRDTIINEANLLEVQERYFRFVQQNLLFGEHRGVDFVQAIKEVAFEKLGGFELINGNEYGEETQYYIPRNLRDEEYENLEELYKQLLSIGYKEFNKKKIRLIQIEKQIRKMSARIVRIRLKPNNIAPLADKISCFGIYKLSGSYSSTTGVDLSNANQII